MKNLFLIILALLFLGCKNSKKPISEDEILGITDVSSVSNDIEVEDTTIVVVDIPRVPSTPVKIVVTAPPTSNTNCVGILDLFISKETGLIPVSELSITMNKNKLTLTKEAFIASFNILDKREEDKSAVLKTVKLELESDFNGIPIPITKVYIKLTILKETNTILEAEFVDYVYSSTFLIEKYNDHLAWFGNEEEMKSTKIPLIKKKRNQLYKQHTIREGQSLLLLAFKWGVSLDQILDVNPSIRSPNKIKPGQVINVPLK